MNAKYIAHQLGLFHCDSLTSKSSLLWKTVRYVTNHPAPVGAFCIVVLLVVVEVEEGPLDPAHRPVAEVDSELAEVNGELQRGPIG